jgi:hypothetical protein
VLIVACWQIKVRESAVDYLYILLKCSTLNAEILHILEVQGFNLDMMQMLEYSLKIGHYISFIYLFICGLFNDAVSSSDCSIGCWDD